MAFVQQSIADEPDLDMNLFELVDRAVQRHLSLYYNNALFTPPSSLQEVIEDAQAKGRQREIRLSTSIPSTDIFLDINSKYKPNDTFARDFLVLRTSKLVPLELLIETLEKGLPDSREDKLLEASKVIDPYTLSTRLDSFFGPVGRSTIPLAAWQKGNERVNVYHVVQSDEYPGSSYWIKNHPNVRKRTVAITEGWTPAKAAYGQFLHKDLARVKNAQLYDHSGKLIEDANAIRFYVGSFSPEGSTLYKGTPVFVSPEGREIDFKNMSEDDVKKLLEYNRAGQLRIMKKESSGAREITSDEFLEEMKLAQGWRESLKKNGDDWCRKYFGNTAEQLILKSRAGKPYSLKSFGKASAYNEDHFLPVEPRNWLFKKPEAKSFGAYNELRIPLPQFQFIGTQYTGDDYTHNQFVKGIIEMYGKLFGHLASKASSEVYQSKVRDTIQDFGLEELIKQLSQQEARIITKALVPRTKIRETPKPAETPPTETPEKKYFPLIPPDDTEIVYIKGIEGPIIDVQEEPQIHKTNYWKTATIALGLVAALATTTTFYFATRRPIGVGEKFRTTISAPMPTQTATQKDEQGRVYVRMEPYKSLDEQLKRELVDARTGKFQTFESGVLGNKNLSTITLDLTNRNFALMKGSYLSNGEYAIAVRQVGPSNPLPTLYGNPGTSRWTATTLSDALTGLTSFFKYNDDPKIIAAQREKVANILTNTFGYSFDPDRIQFENNGRTYTNVRYAPTERGRYTDTNGLTIPPSIIGKDGRIVLQQHVDLVMPIRDVLGLTLTVPK